MEMHVGSQECRLGWAGGDAGHGQGSLLTCRPWRCTRGRAGSGDPGVCCPPSSRTASCRPAGRTCVPQLPKPPAAPRGVGGSEKGVLSPPGPGGHPPCSDPPGRSQGEARGGRGEAPGWWMCPGGQRGPLWPCHLSRYPAQQGLRLPWCRGLWLSGVSAGHCSSLVTALHKYLSGTGWQDSPLSPPPSPSWGPPVPLQSIHRAPTRHPAPGRHCVPPAAALPGAWGAAALHSWASSSLVPPHRAQPRCALTLPGRVG